MLFGSDNQSGASPQVLDALVEAYSGSADAYGADAFSKVGADAIRETFDTDADVFLSLIHI